MPYWPVGVRSVPRVPKAIEIIELFGLRINSEKSNHGAAGRVKTAPFLRLRGQEANAKDKWE